MRISAMLRQVSSFGFSLVKQKYPLDFIDLLLLGQRLSTSNIPPPLPMKPKASLYSQLSNDTTGTYVQPQLILPATFRQQQSPTRINSPIRNIDAGPAAKLAYTTKASPTVLNPYEHQKPPTYLSQLVWDF